MTAPVGTNPTQLDPTASYSDIINYYLGQWGLTSLAPLVSSLGKTGATNDQISLQLQNSPEWAQRFAGNTQRVANGLAALDPATYIAMEGQYRQILSGLPSGFYDTDQHLAGLIGGDVSASELSQRVQDANTAWVNAPQANRDAWTAYGYGGAQGAVAAILDQSTAEPLIQQQVTAAGIGGAALGQGLSLTNQGTAVKAAQQGVTIQGAQQAYAQIAQRMSTDQSISTRFAGSTSGAFGQEEEENATLLGNAAATKQQNLLYSEESAQFGGHGAADNNGATGNPGANY